MSIITRAATFYGDILNNKTYHVYSVGNGNQFKFNSETAVWDDIGWLVINNGATVEFIFHTRNTINLTGNIRIERGTLKMSLADDYAVPVGQPTLKNVTADQHNLFHLHNSQTDSNQCKLTITGLSDKHFIIDGGANITYEGSNATVWSATNSGIATKGALLLLQGGKATLGYVDLRNNWFYIPGGSYVPCEGAAVHLTTESFQDYSYPNQIWGCYSECVLEMTNCNISGCAARRWGSAIGLFGGKKNGNMSTAKLTDCTVTGCFNIADMESAGSGGTIRTAGNTVCKLEMTRCTVSGNKSNGVGGGVFWEASMSPPLEMTDCVIESNYTNNAGGGLNLSSPTVLKGCKIRNNYAKSVGGGLRFTPYTGPSNAYQSTNYFPSDATITLDANTEITGNHSESDGGGMHVDVVPMNFAYDANSSGYNPWTVFYSGNSTGTGHTNEQYKINIKLNGAKISNNSAKGNGGGICMTRNTDIYQTNVVLDWGKVENNTASAGGACYINSYIQSINYHGTCPFPNTNMNIELGSATASDNLSLVGNQAKNGGGLYVYVYHNTSVTSSVVNTTVYKNGNIGTQAQPNIANNGSGGAMFIHNGNIILKGGNVNYNTATKNGGGIYPAGSSIIKVGTGSLTVKDNTSNAVPNNIYLPTGKTIDIMSGATFNPVYVGVYTQSDTRPIAVIAGTIAGLATGTKDNVHDDKQLAGTTLSDKLYFGGSPWSPLQQTVNTLPAKVNNVYQIGTVEELTAFLWLVNNIDTHHNFNEDLEEGETTHPDASAKLTADIDMEGHYWMPFADYSGTFDGNGHTITGITMVPTNVSTERGLFGVNASGTIKNVNLRDCYFAGGGSYIGSIVSQMNGGTLYNSVAQCQLLATATTTKAGGLVGHINGGEVHSSVSTCEMTGYTMGGLAGTNAGNIYNSFANPKFTYSGPYVTTSPTSSTDYYVGGLVATNTGQIENCYVRLERTQTLGTAHFGMLAGSNTGTESIVSCYAPNGDAAQFNHSHNYLYGGVTTGLKDYDLYNKVIAPYLYSHSNDNTLVNTSGTNLLEILNRWVEAPAHSSGGYSPWKRTTAGGYSYTYDDGGEDVTVIGGNINGDYPIHKMVGLSCAASPDGLTIEYKKSLDDMIEKYNGLSGGGTIWLYDSPKEDDGSDELVSETNDGDVLLYIDEDASLLQSNNAKGTLTAYTGQTLKTYSETNGNRWHLFSSPLQQSQIGISYTETGSVPFSWASNPCGVQFSADNDNALFPSDMPVSAFDLYSFYEPEYHWINFRRNSNSHWHENANEVQIHYNGNGTGGDGNETYLVPGKGYLVSINQEQLVQNKGTLNNGNVTLQNVTKTDFNAWAGLLGFNLLGNPYQSYLDFEKFINDGNGTNNGANLWEGTSEYTNTYATYDPSQKAYVQYKSGASGESNTASQYIHPHQGFFVRMTKGGENTNTTTVTYTNDMRTNATNTQSGFRSDGSQPAYPLVNFTVRDGDGNADVAVLEIGRDADEGAPKMRLGDCTGALSLGHEGKDYGILFRMEVEDYQPLRFEAMEAGTFTLTWNTANADFERLTLIDNIAGTETDMLARDTYRFEATTDQYASRFKVVIGDYKGIDEPEGDGPSTGSGTSMFAFQMGDQLVVNGEGNLQVVDMLGRVVMTERLTSSQNMVGLPKAAGVYVLRLTDGGGTRTQKMVVGL